MGADNIMARAGSILFTVGLTVGLVVGVLLRFGARARQSSREEMRRHVHDWEPGEVEMWTRF